MNFHWGEQWTPNTDHTMYIHIQHILVICESQNDKMITHLKRALRQTTHELLKLFSFWFLFASYSSSFVFFVSIASFCIAPWTISFKYNVDNYLVGYTLAVSEMETTFNTTRLFDKQFHIQFRIFEKCCTYNGNLFLSNVSYMKDISNSHLINSSALAVRPPDRIAFFAFISHTHTQFFIL